MDPDYPEATYLKVVEAGGISRGGLLLLCPACMMSREHLFGQWPLCGTGRWTRWAFLGLIQLRSILVFPWSSKGAVWNIRTTLCTNINKTLLKLLEKILEVYILQGLEKTCDTRKPFFRLSRVNFSIL